MSTEKDKYSEYLAKFTKLAEAASFYLHESFNYIHQCYESELAGLLFGELIMTVDTSEADNEIMGKAEFPEKVIDLLTNEVPEVISDETHDRISELWSIAIEFSTIASHNFQKNQKVDSIELLGHVTNFAFFFETLVNRHLLFLLVSEEIDSFTYNNLNRAKLLTRLTYIFKTELLENKISINEIANLFKLRNKTVHFTPDNAIALTTKAEVLFKIWEQTKLILNAFQSIENLNEQSFSELIDEEVLALKERFFDKQNTKLEDLILKVREVIERRETNNA